jgi:hypothetical protein
MTQFHIDGKAVFGGDNHSNRFAKRLSARAERRKANTIIAEQIEPPDDGPDWTANDEYEYQDFLAGHPTYDCFAHL